MVPELSRIFEGPSLPLELDADISVIAFVNNMGIAEFLTERSPLNEEGIVALIWVALQEVIGMGF